MYLSGYGKHNYSWVLPAQTASFYADAGRQPMVRNVDFGFMSGSHFDLKSTARTIYFHCNRCETGKYWHVIFLVLVFWHRVNYSCNLPAIDIICCCVPWTFSSSVPLGAVPCPPSDKWWNTHISDFPFLYMQWLFTVSLHWCAALNRLKNRVSDYLEVLLFSFKFHFFFAWLAMTGSDQTDVMIDEWMLHAPSEFVPAGDVCLTSLRPWGRRHI